MRKIAIVGPEGSGKTVMLAGLGSLYERPDAEGYYLEPIDRTTYAYVSGLVHGMRSGHWPAATETDAQKRLTWNLRKRDGDTAGDAICRISFLDFAGEIYRDAFGREKSSSPRSSKSKSGSRGKGASTAQALTEDCAFLRRSIRQADVVFVLVNLSDIITGRGGSPRATEIGWATKSILDYICAPNRSSYPTTVLVLSQADSYQNIIEAEGGPKQVLEKYLPIVGVTYGDIEVITASSVDKVKLDDDGGTVPDDGFSFDGLKVIVDVILREMAEADASEAEEETVAVEAKETKKESEEKKRKHQLAVDGCGQMISGSVVVAAFLVFISLCNGYVASSGVVLAIITFCWLLWGLSILWSGIKKMASGSVSGLIGTAVLIGVLGGIGAQFIATSDFLKGLEAVWNLYASVLRKIF